MILTGILGARPCSTVSTRFQRPVLDVTGVASRRRGHCRAVGEPSVALPQPTTQDPVRGDDPPRGRCGHRGCDDRRRRFITGSHWVAHVGDSTSPLRTCSTGRRCDHRHLAMPPRPIARPLAALRPALELVAALHVRLRPPLGRACRCTAAVEAVLAHSMSSAGRSASRSSPRSWQLEHVVVGEREAVALGGARRRCARAALATARVELHLDQLAAQRAADQREPAAARSGLCT